MSQEHLTRTIAILEKVAEAELPDVNLDTDLDSLPLDSLDLFTAVGDLEEATGRSMSDDQLGEASKVGDLVKHFFG